MNGWTVSTSRQAFACQKFSSSISSWGQRKSKRLAANRLVPAIQALALTDPSEVIQEALVSLRRNDLDRFRLLLAASLPDQSGGNGNADSCLPYPFQDDRQTLSEFRGILDVGSRRLLPENLLRRCQAVSSVRIGPDNFVQRVAVTAKSGEEGILEWRLKRQASGAWRIADITHDLSTPDPLPSEPHPRLSPEVVVASMRKWLSMNVIWRAAQFLDFQGSRREKELALHSMLLEEKALLYLCQPHKALESISIELCDRTTVRIQTQIVAVPPRGSQRHIQMNAQSFIWTVHLGTTGCWGVTTIEASAGFSEPQN